MSLKNFHKKYDCHTFHQIGTLPNPFLQLALQAIGIPSKDLQFDPIHGARPSLLVLLVLVLPENEFGKVIFVGKARSLPLDSTPVKP